MQVPVHQDPSIGPVDEEELAELNDNLSEKGCKVDPVFLNYICQWNGATPHMTHPSIGKIERFLHLANSYNPKGGNAAQFNINRVVSQLGNRLPLGFLPFAALAHGDLLCIACSSDGTSSVVKWFNDKQMKHQQLFKDFELFLRSLNRPNE